MTQQATNPECPTWLGASGSYNRAYRILEGMAKAGHVTPYLYGPVGRGLRGRVIMGMRQWVSDEMKDSITALNEGDEEKVKGNNLRYARYLK